MLEAKLGTLQNYYHSATMTGSLLYGIAAVTALSAVILVPDEYMPNVHQVYVAGRLTLR